MSHPSDSSRLNQGETSAGVTLQPMGFADILDAMFSIYRNHFRLFVVICSVYFVWEFITYLLIGVTAVLAPGSGRFSVPMLIVFVLSLISHVVMIFVKGGLFFGSAQAFLGVQIAPKAAFEQVKRRFWPFLASHLLYGIIVGLLVITLIGIPFALFFGFRWIFYSLTAIFEEKPAVGALKRSSELVNGGWWRVFGIMLGIFLLVSVIESIPGISMGVVEGLRYGREIDEDLLEEAMQGEEDPLEILKRSSADILWSMLGFMSAPQITTWIELFSYVIRNCFSLVITCLMLPVGIIGATLVYFDRRIRNEAFDIEVMAARRNV